MTSKNTRNFQACFLALFAVALFFSACGGGSDTPPKTPAEPAETFYEKERFFSSEAREDKFYLGYFGSPATLLDTSIYFFVVNPDGDTLFKDTWAAVDLLDARGQGLATVKEKADYVVGKLQEIIEDRSLPPAVVIKSPDSDTTKSEAVRKQAEMVFTYKIGQKVKVLSWIKEENRPNILEF